MGWYRDLRGPTADWVDASVLIKRVRRLVILVVGTTVLLVGVALLVLPGPAFVVIPTGLAILGCEFVWARRWLARLRDSAVQLGQQVQSMASSKDEPDVDEPR